MKAAFLAVAFALCLGVGVLDAHEGLYGGSLGVPCSASLAKVSVTEAAVEERRASPARSERPWRRPCRRARPTSAARMVASVATISSMAAPSLPSKGGADFFAGERGLTVLPLEADRLDVSGLGGEQRQVDPGERIAFEVACEVGADGELLTLARRALAPRPSSVCLPNWIVTSACPSASDQRERRVGQAEASRDASGFAVSLPKLFAFCSPRMSGISRFSISAGRPNFSFTVQPVGADFSTVTLLAPLVLIVSDFAPSSRVAVDERLSCRRRRATGASRVRLDGGEGRCSPRTSGGDE